MNGCIYRKPYSKSSPLDLCEKYTDKTHLSFCDIDHCDSVCPSNGDRIRNMTDEELATWIETIADCHKCPIWAMNRGTVSDSCMGDAVNSRASCRLHWLDWLQKEAI